MGSSLDELRKRIYGSATPDENTVRKVQQKAVEVTPPKTEFTGGTTTRTPWSELSGRLESSISALDSGRENIENLDALYRKDRSELNRVNYNNAVTRYNQELERYNSLVTDYEYYTSVDGIKARAEEAKAALKSAQDEYLRIASEGQGARTYGALAGLKTTSGKSAVEAKKAVEEAKANYNKILQEYYAAENSSKKSDLTSNASLSKTYTDAKEIESDLDLVVKAMSRGPATTSATGLSADESAYLQKKYGLSAADLMYAGSTKLPELQQKLSKTLADSKDTLAAAGYQYDRLSEYDQRQQKALEYAATQAEIEEFAKAHSVIASAASVIAAPLQGVDYLRVVLSNAGNSDTSDLDTYVPPNVYDADLVNFVNTVRGTVGDEIAQNLDWEIYGQNVAQFLYQTGMSIADSTAQIALLGPAASLTLGSSAAASTAADIVARGGTSDQAFWGGLAAGAAETVFEKVSIDRLLKIKSPDTFRDALKAAGWQAVTEGSEETLTEISNILSDAVIMGQDSSFRVAVETYMENDGLTQDEAEKRAFMDCVAQVLWATAGGAISGSTLAGGKLSFGAVSQNRAAAKTGAQVKSGFSNGVNTSVFAEIQKGMDAQENSEAHRLAQDAQRQLDEKKRVSNVTLGKLTWANKTLEMTDLQILAETGADNTAAKEILQEAAAEYVSSGALTSSTAARVRTVAGQIATGAVTQEQKAAAAEAANPGATVKSPTVTVFTDLGMSLKTAETKAEIVQKLMSGEEVSNRDINKLDPTSAKMRAAFSQITGVQFPEGKLSQEQLYSLYRSAASVKSTADVVAESDISAIQDRVRSGVTAETGPEILQAAMNATAATKPETDAAAARMIAEQLGEIDQNGDPLVSFRDFSNAYRSQVNPTATREELARAYDQYRSDLGTTEFGGNRMTRSQFEAMLREAPGGQNLTSEEIDSLYAMSQSANKNGEDGYDRFSLSGEERSERRILRRIPAEQREQVSAEMSHRGELERAAKYMSSVLRDLGIAPGVVVEYGDENTRLAEAYVDADGRIHFNGDKISGAGMMQYILGHELTHTAARITGDTSVTDAVIDAFRKLNSAGVLSGETARWMSDVDGRLDTLLNRYRRHAKSVGDDASRIDRDYVREELAADLMRQVFVSEDLMSRLAGERPSLLMRARNAADRILAKLTRNSELQMVVDARDELRRLGDLFENTLRKSEAESTYRSDHVVETRDGSPVAVSDENGDMKFSLSTYDSEGRDILREWLDVAVERGDLTREDADSITVSLEEIYRVCRDHQKDYAPFDNWSEAKVVTDENGRPVFSVVKANGEYALNLDFSTVCKKRRTLDAVLNELVRSGWASENQIADAQMVKINDIIRDHGFETACALCFVDAKRFRQDKIATNFTEMYNRAVRSLVPEDSGIPVNTFDFSGRGTELQESGLETRPDAELDFSGLQKTMSRFGDKTVSHKIAKHLMENPGDRKMLDKGDFLSSAGFNVIAREKPEILSLFNAKKGSGGPKSTFGDVQYLNEIISSRSFNAEKAFSVGGVRLQSFSDYVPRMVFDYAQVVSDLSAKQLPAQAYTKEELFVKQFGLTGIKINMSLIPRVESDGIAPGLDSRGNYIWADESFDFDTAVEIQSADGYSRNCGTVAVGISDEHIRTLMADDRIRMIIPYHKSGLNPVVARLNNIAQFKDYTLYQNTRGGDGKKLSESASRDVPDFNQEMRRLGDPRAAAESYVRFCESKGYLPKFDQFAYQQVGGVFVEENGQRVVDPNYYKLLEDFTVYDDGEYVGQEAVRPVYPAEDSAFGSMADLILRGLDEDAVLEGRRSSEVASIVQEVQDTLGDVRAGTEPRYALPDRDLSFAEQVDMALSGTLNDVLQGAAHIRGKYGPAESALYVAKEPTALMQEIGFGDLPLVITQQHIRQINARRVDENGTVIDDHNHQLDADTIKSLPDMIASPVAILRAPNRPGSAVIVSDRVDFQGNPIIVPIKSNGLNLVYDGKVGPAHVVTSMYGRENFSRFLTRAVDGGEVLFVDKKRIEPLLLTGGNHRSTLLDGVDSDTILGQITPNVNTQERRYALPDEDLDAAAVDYFGTTRDWSVTGYVQKNGDQLDFSGKKRGGPGDTRDEDHREIWAAYGEPGDMTNIQAEIDYLARGNIRIMPEVNGINLSVQPTKAQETKLRQYITRAGGEVILDVDTLSGKPFQSVEYPRGTSASKVLADIRTILSGETAAPASQVAAFRYSVGGELARQAPMEALQQALDRAKNTELTDSEVQKIWEETGWYRGEDGRWRFEIDDSQAVFYPRGDARRVDNPDWRRFKDLESAYIAGTLSTEEIDEVRQLSAAVRGLPGGQVLQDYLRHDKLYEQYPDLANIPVRVDLPRSGSVNGSLRNGIIHLKPGASEADTKGTLLHEIQHAIQRTEMFESGSNLDIAYRKAFVDAYWAIVNTAKFSNLKTYRGRVNAIEQEIINQVPEAKNYTGTSTGKAKKIQQMFRAVFDVYQRSIGETEARNTTDRVNLTAQERRSIAPYFARDGVSTRDQQYELNDYMSIQARIGYNYDGSILAPTYNEVRSAAGYVGGVSAMQNADTRYSITPEFEQWYRENYGAEEDITDRQLQRAMQRQERKTQMAEESAQAARTKAAVDAENTLTAWLIYHKKNMRRLNRDLQKKSADQLAELRREKAQAIREVTELERAKAAVQHDADVMAFKRQAAARLRVKDGQYTELKEKTREQTRLKRKAAERALKDSRQAAKKRAELEIKNGVVKTIREIPGEKRRIEKLQEQAANLKTLWRPAYSAFVNQAKAIDDFAKRQSGGTLSSTLVNVLGGSSTTIESVFKRGLVDRSGNRIGDAMKDVFLVWDGKKVDEAKQALLQDYMLHAHNVDRMSFVKNARARLEAFEAENPWLRDMDQKEFAKLVAMTESEIEKTGKKKAHDLAGQYAQLLDQYNRSQDKPIFADADGNAVTADTSRAIVEQYLAENPWLAEKAQGIYDWWDQFMRTWAVGDSLTLEQYETMREIYPHYVPTYRADKKGVGAANFVGAGGATIGTAVKKAKGGLSEVVNIEDSFANLANKIIKLARTNELYKNIIDTALLEDGADSNVADMAVFDWDSVTMGDSYKTESGEIVSTFSNGFDMSDHVDEAERPGLLKTKDGYKLSAWYDGQLLSAYVSEDLYKSIARVTGSDANDFSRAFLRVGNALTGPMKTAITGINPAFAMRNISRDLPTAVVNSISGAAFLKYYGHALTEMRRNSDNWQVFQALGGTHAGYYNNNKGFAGAMSQRDNILAKTGAALGRFNDITEAQTRFAEYLATIDRLGDTYENRMLGIKNAAEVTVDFSRKGWVGKYINAWVPYWNPAVQGIDKVVRSLVDSPDGSKIWKQASRTLGRAALGTVMLESILQVVLTALGRRDEWEQLDDRTKDTYYCIPLADSYTFLKIPKNREWGAILGTPFMRMLEWANGRDDPFENYLETSIIPNFLPPLPSDTVGFSQWNDLSTNEDFAGRAIVPYAYEQGSLTEQYDAETSLVSKAIAQLLNFSPMQLDYIITDYFGDFGEMYQKATAPGTWSGDSGVAEFGKSVADIFFGGFEADARYSNAAVSKYYDTMDRLAQVVQDKKNHMGSEDYKETVEYQTQTAINKLYGNAITDLNTEVRNLPDGEEKDALKAQIASLAAEAMDFYNQSMAGNVESPVLQAEYDEYDSSVRNELIDLDNYSSEYKFKPTGNASASYTDPENSDREFILTEDQKDRFHEIYVEQYNEMVGDLIRQNQYRSATGEKRAELLEDLRDDVLDETKKEFFRWLDQTGVRSTLKTR